MFEVMLGLKSKIPPKGRCLVFQLYNLWFEAVPQSLLEVFGAKDGSLRVDAFKSCSLSVCGQEGHHRSVC
ncbi:hypothetical protein ACHAWF_016477 [Thalassiosira exigua]